MDTAEITELNHRFAAADPGEILAWALSRFGERLVIASSFGIEDVMLIHLAHASGLPYRVITLDTGRLPVETYQVMERVRNRYDRTLEVYFPQAHAVEQLTREAGFFSFYESVDARKACCTVRKIEPLRRALATCEAWVTGLRRAQSETRTDVLPLEIDVANGSILKVNPLVALSEDDVWAYVRAHNVPINALHERGYPSIGCAPCTRAVKPGEGIRAGRWWWENPAQRECGLHASTERA